MSLETINIDRLGLRPGDKLLDLGCGEGRHSISAFLQGDIQVVGLDLSAKDLATAKGRLADFNIDADKIDYCLFIQGSGFTLPFADHTFDQVICSEVLEHIVEYEKVLSEIKRVLKPGGVFAVSVPRYFPEWVCWKLSDAYHEVEGGHVRIFNINTLKQQIAETSMHFIERHWAHSLHVPYWWLRCLFWSRDEHKPAEEAHWLVRQYHRFLVWDLMQQPKLTQILDHLLNPFLGKSVVMYFRNN
ncbi:MAG: methyltransferase domain-containing protein [Gammaproteobacteria bacterium]|jgi:ubiquinone/menaquinone biosynthesis C-methylase UbiE|nr:methyltransferase domain-containing protein [Gammaproteobacteria bacterium]